MKYKKLLVVPPDAIGDFLLVTPFLESLKKTYPDLVIGVIASRRSMALARNNPNIDLVHFLDVRKKSTLPGLIWQVRKQHYDLFIDLWGRLFPSALKFFVRLSGIKTKFALQKMGKFRTLHYEHCYDKVFPMAKGQVRMSYNNILEYLGAPPVTEQMRNTYIVPAHLLAKARQYIKRPAVVLVCQGSREGNTLPTNTCVEVINGLLQATPNLRIFLSSSPGENNIASNLAALVGEERLTALPDIDGALDFTAAAVSLADVVISTSTGTLHIADAFDIPTVGIYPPICDSALGPDYEGYHHFLPQTSKRAVICSTSAYGNAFPVDAGEIIDATLSFLLPDGPK